MGENSEARIVMLTIKEAVALVDGLTEYRVRQMCINDQVPHIMAGKKYLINKELFFRYLHASLLIFEGVDIVAVSADMGHGVVSMTLNLYSHMFQKARARNCDAITNALKFTHKPTECVKYDVQDRTDSKQFGT